RDDEPALVELDAPAVAVEIVGVGTPPGGNEQVRALDLSLARESNDHVTFLDADAFGLLAELEGNALVRENGLDFPGNRCLFRIHQLGAVLDDRHLRAEASKHLRKLTADVASAHHDQVL